MPNNAIQYNQSNFNRGEIDGLLGARFDYEDYDKALKRARNCITLPQGAISRRWGSQIVANYTSVTSGVQIEVSPILYNDDTTFLVVWTAGVFDVYIENTIFQTGTASGSPVYAAVDIVDLRFSQSNNNLVITNPNFTPRGLQLTPTTRLITSVTTTTMVVSAATFSVGQIFPIIFTVGTYVTSPQIYLNRTYYARATSTTAFNLYSTAQDAAARVNAYAITSASSTPTATSYNAWAISNIPFSILPTFDFTNGFYQTTSNTFIAGAVGPIGATTTITCNNAIFTAANFPAGLMGGLFFGNGGALRIVSFSSTVLTGYVVFPFANATQAVPGTLVSILSPVWSAVSGYPRCSTTFQGRLFFAGSPAIPNGVWGSIVNEQNNFDDSEADASSAISYYPASGNITYIQSMTAARSLLVHTSTGSFSTALSTEQPLTPANISFTEQNKDGASELQPVFIDNQVIYIDSSHNNVKNLIWELSQSSYILRNISIISSSLIRKPIDIANYSNPLFIDGSYVLLVNSDGTMAVFNTLYMENVAGWTLQNSGQWADDSGLTLIPNPYVHVVSSFERAWFVAQRIFYTSGSPINIVTISGAPNYFFGMGSSSTVNATGIWQAEFTIAPTTSPQVVTGKTYYARQLNNITYVIYPTYDDALNRTNPILPQSTSGTIRFYNPATTFCLEELSFTVPLDSFAAGSIVANTFTFSVSAQAANYNGQWVYIYVDEGAVVLEDGATVPVGYALGPYQVLNNVITGIPIATASLAYIGFPFETQITFLPINLLLGTGANFYQNKMLRVFYLYYYQTLGAKINGISFPKIPLYDYPLGSPLTPQTDIVKLPPMTGWEPLQQDITITQTEPYPMTILGYSAAVEVT